MSRARGLKLASLTTVALALIPLGTSGAQVAFERAGYRLTSIGERISVSGRVIDARRRPVASAKLRWRVADPSIATVTPQGVLVSRRPGNTKLWAVAGQDSASALILVDQWAAKFDFLPSVVRLDAVDAKAPLRIIVRDAAGTPITSPNRRPSSCRSVNERVATLAPNGQITARSNGVTYVRCADRGIADSVRVEVRQRPARATIADKLNLNNKILGDTFRIRVSATDATGGAIENVQATWASLNPTIVNVDPLTGLARTVGAGTARIVAQAGDVTDTVSIAVAPGQGLAVPLNADAAADTSTATSARMPTLRIDAVYPFEGDSTSIRVTARDAAGIEVPNPDLTLRSGDTAVFVVLPGQRILAKKAGSALLIGRYGTSAIDSTLITVRTRSSNRPVLAGNAAPTTFVRPTFDTTTLYSRYRNSRDSAVKDIFDSTRVVGLKAPGRLVSFSIQGGQASHSFSDSTGKENRSGLMYGGIAEIVPIRWVKLSGEFRTGTLTSTGDAADLAVTEAGANLIIQPAEAFVFGGGYMVRATREGPSGEPLALQQWTIPRAFATMRLAFVGGRIRTITGASIMPAAGYTGYVDAQGNKVKPDFLSLAGEAGVEVKTGWLRTGLTYYFERFSFPKVGTSERRDQFSAIRLRLGLEYSR